MCLRSAIRQISPHRKILKITNLVSRTSLQKYTGLKYYIERNIIFEFITGDACAFIFFTIFGLYLAKFTYKQADLFDYFW